MHPSLFPLLASVALAARLAISFQVLNGGSLSEKQNIYNIFPVILNFDNGSMMIRGQITHLDFNIEAHYVDTTEDKKYFSIYTIHQSVDYERDLDGPIFFYLSNEGCVVEHFRNKPGKHVIVERIIGESPKIETPISFDI